MEEKPPQVHDSEGGAFVQSQVTFDLDEEVEVPVKKRKKRKHKAVRRVADNEEIGTQCPGCGTHIEDDEFLDCIISFVIGAHDRSVNDPVRTRFIQTLRNETIALPTPRPTETWALEIANRIEQQIFKLLEAERLRRGATMENRLRGELEVEIRQRIEAEIWAQVEAGLAKDMAEGSEE